MFWPCDTRTSTCRNFATISSGLYRFLAIAVLLDVKDIPQVGPLQWGPISYDDGAFSGASLERPALQQLLADVQTGKIDIVLVYKVDRLTRSLADFAKLIELFDAHNVSFVSVTQSFNTS